MLFSMNSAVGCLDKALESEVQPRSGGRRERARVGGLGIGETWKPAARRGLPGSQDSSFSFSRPGSDPGGRDRGRRSGGLET